MIDDGIQYDWERRLRNALVVLAELGPAWGDWVEPRIPQGLTVEQMARLAERGARCMTVRHYSAMMGRGQKRRVIDSDFYFTDDGSLKTYF